MDSINSFKGYGKMSEAADREFRRRTRRRLILIAVSLLLLLVIVVGVTATAVVHKRNSSSSPAAAPSTPSVSIKTVCSVTRYPDLCFSSISSAAADGNYDPKHILKLSLNVVASSLSNLSSLVDTMIDDASSNNNHDPRLRQAILDCKDLFADALDRLNESITSLQPAGGDSNSKQQQQLLSASTIDDLKSWLSAAIADQETCLDGFEGTVGDARERMEAAMFNSTRFNSNSLAIVARVVGVIDKLKVPFHRRLLAGVDDEEEGWRRRTEESMRPNVTVAKDRSGEVRTIMEALQMVPKHNMVPFVIYVKEGVYEEKVVVEKNVWNVHMVGDGMYNTIVTGSSNFIDGTPTFATATFSVKGRGFVAQDMGFRNSAGPSKHQAVALYCRSDKSIFHRCSFDGYQDTLYVHSLRQFYRDCDITGTVDFIFGDASVVFQNCTIRPRQPMANQQNTITAQGRTDPNENTGIAIQACTISSYDHITVPTFLGRPWKNYSVTVVMQSHIGSLVDPAGWQPWVPGTRPPQTILYAEYNNTGPGSTTTDRVKWAGYRPTITAQEANRFTVGSFIKGQEWIPETGVDFASTL